MPGVAVAPPVVVLAAGFYGKVPVKGDFVSRRLPRAFVDPWDEWLRSALQVSRERLGDAWLPAYLAGPIWRFVLGAGVCGGSVTAGLLMPSVDRVGRYFPFALAIPVPGRPDAVALAADAGSWFEQAERLLLSALDDAFDIESFDIVLRQLGAPRYAAADTALLLAEAASNDRRFPVLGDASSTLRRHVVALPSGHSIWWTDGSDTVRPSLLLCRGLPRPLGFAAMLDGQWERAGWAEPVE